MVVDYQTCFFYNHLSHRSLSHACHYVLYKQLGLITPQYGFNYALLLQEAADPRLQLSEIIVQGLAFFEKKKKVAENIRDVQQSVRQQDRHEKRSEH